MSWVFKKSLSPGSTLGCVNFPGLKNVVKIEVCGQQGNTGMVEHLGDRGPERILNQACFNAFVANDVGE